MGRVRVACAGSRHAAGARPGVGTDLHGRARNDAAARRHLRATCVVEALVISMGVLLVTAAMSSGGF